MNENKIDKRYKLNKNQQEQAIKDYFNGKKPIDIGIEYGVARGYVQQVLKSRGIPSLGITKLKKVNDHYLDELDTPNKAYFLGFMYADGCILDKTRVQKQIVINLNERDVDILHKFKKELEFEGDLHFYDGSKIHSTENYSYKRNNLYRLSITSDRLCDNLIKLGCWQRKSHTCKFPTLDQVPEYLMPHFIRGLFDGDGYIAKYHANKDKNPCFTFGIIGTLNICEGVRNWLSNKLILNPLKKIKYDGVHGITYSRSKDLIKIFNYLYPKENTELFLQRKYDKFKEIFNYTFNSQASYEENLILKNL